jgi:hypothetical protein
MSTAWKCDVVLGGVYVTNCLVEIQWEAIVDSIKIHGFL